ncbi:hypothetical protein DICPUDRAFT_151033 [Dictyostelium purpureum]|uniref:Uncharacterized protein n=1 Tax=Dictyostelium purpureum TaxID=5786 RepID=F0ZHU6_DICPU|nr:uncharacterized protein DICPUDRAFT_151033 [Dictyostelium purpureum]EGC36483.1 hypothetical protein DICPUDRAFT_151033 [Dictyostelium purpureum]|eukprot:XP_003286996.1 hypothetical protein DICPUDRAFT_151033 [Dictyostelium purpureum]
MGEFLKINVPECPSGLKINEYFSYPSISLIFACLALSCFIFAIIIAFKYNSVDVFNKKIRTQTISNTLWIVYYLALGLRGASNTIRYAMDKTQEQQVEEVFFIASLTLHGFTALALSLALNHQRRYRSTSQQNTHREHEPLLLQQIQQENRHSSKFTATLKKHITPLEIFFLICFVCFLVFLYLEVDKEDTTFYYVLLGFFILQHIPIIVLVFIIAFSLSREGPTKKSRAFLILGAIFNLSNYLPLFVWAKYLPGGCPMYIFSYVDLIQIFDFASLLFFFLFLRSEYVRNQEECIWTAVSQIQDTFDFRLF